MVEVYHGSVYRVDSPFVMLGRDNLDFGKGFYVTYMREQAVQWAIRMGQRKLSQPILNRYLLDMEAVKRTYRCLFFHHYDKAWLDFIAASRKGTLPWKGYDFIEGGVANDNVIDTVEDYINGRMSAQAALAELSKHQPNHQGCILNQEIVDRYLLFQESENL